MSPSVPSRTPRRPPHRHPRLGLVPAAVLALGVLALAAAGCGGDSAAETGPAPEPAERAVPVSAVEVQPEAVTDLLELPADLLPDRRAVLAAEAAGRVEAVTVEEGQAVAAGRTLATIDTRALSQEVAEAEALERQAEAQFGRAEALFERRSITKKDLLDAVTARDVARARLASAKLALAKSRLAAPWSGRVAARRVEVGDYVVPGQPMIELVDLDPIEVRAPVPAADVPYVEVGEPVEVTISSFPGETFTGRVVRLAPELDAAARTLALEAEIANPGGRVKPGMLARLELPRRSFDAALLVPLDAVLELEEGRAVYVVRGERAERVGVVLGAVIGERVVIEQGLEPGDRVVVRGQARLSPGQRVEATIAPSVREVSAAASAAAPAAPAEAAP